MMMIQSVLASLFLIACVPGVISVTNQHTACYDYFRAKDHCVNAAANPEVRCKRGVEHSTPVHSFSSSGARLSKRYDVLSARVMVGDNACPTIKVDGRDFDPKKDLGVCLWNGGQAGTGWIDNQIKNNCGKRIYIQRKDQEKTVQFATVIDSCGFYTEDLGVGCFEIGINQALFDKFNPSDKEKTGKALEGGMTWDFDNLNGQDQKQGPI